MKDLLKPTEHHGTMVSRALRGVLNQSPLFREALASHMADVIFPNLKGHQIIVFFIQCRNIKIPKKTAIFDWASERSRLMALKLLGTIKTIVGLNWLTNLA